MKKILPIVLTIGIIITGILAIPMGSVPIPLEYIFSPGKAPDYIKTIIFNLRLPRIIMSLLIGMMLASSGVVVQTVFQNPLADPYIIGIAASATFGAVIAFVLNLPDFMYGVLAFITCLASTLLIFKMAKKEPINVNLLMSDAKLIGGDGIEITTNENNDLIIGLSGAGSRLIKYERSDIEYGKDGDDYTWEDNILTCIHNLGIQLPLVMVYVTPKNGTAEETEDLLKISPTKFWGPEPNQIGNYTIAGHNNRDGTMFGKTKYLRYFWLNSLLKISFCNIGLIASLNELIINAI